MFDCSYLNIFSGPNVDIVEYFHSQSEQKAFLAHSFIGISLLYIFTGAVFLNLDCITGSQD